MRIWYQSLSETASSAGYAQRLRDHVHRVAADDAEVDVHGMPPGVYGGDSPIEVQRLPHVFQEIFAPRLGACIDDAVSDGCDAVIFGCYSEPWLRESRARASVPVLSVFESSLLASLPLGRLVGLITTAPEIAYMHRRLIREAGLSERVSGCYVIDPPLTEKQAERALDEPEPILEAFRDAAARAVADYADVVIPAEGILNAAVAEAGLTQVDGAAVVDGIGITVLDAIMKVRMRERCGAGVGRRWEYPQQRGRVPWDRTG